MDRLIVDGYNIIFAWPELAALAQVSLEDARAGLISLLADYSALTRIRVTVVFDSHRREEGKATSENISGVEVMFSGKKASADHIIERLVYEARAADEVTIATSDAVQRDMALGKGVKTISAMLFKAQVSDALSRRDRQISDRRAHSDLARRVEDRLDPRTRERLDRIRRGLEQEPPVSGS
jgi:predicted RNA-binding protein with PIN domain